MQDFAISLRAPFDKWRVDGGTGHLQELLLGAAIGFSLVLHDELVCCRRFAHGHNDGDAEAIADLLHQFGAEAVHPADCVHQ